MNKYGTPQQVTQKDSETVVSVKPLQPCCEKTADQMQKKATPGHVHSSTCGCGNKLEVSKA